MKNITVRNKQNEIISDLNLYETEEQIQEFIRVNREHNVFGRDERWVRAFIDPELQTDDPDGDIVFSPIDEYFEHEDILEWKTEIENEIEVTYVKLRADYTIEITDYVPPVPEKLTRRQALLVMLEFGILDEIENFINQPTTDRKVKIEFYESQDFHRNWDTLNLVAGQMGITQEQLDNMFRLGATL